MAGRPVLRQLDVPPHPLGMRQIAFRILQERVDLETDVTVVSRRLLPDRQKFRLRAAHQPIGHLPGNLPVVSALGHQAGHLLVKSAALQQLRDNDRIGSRTRRPQGTIRGDQARVDRIQPQFGPARDQ